MAAAPPKTNPALAEAFKASRTPKSQIVLGADLEPAFAQIEELRGRVEVLEAALVLGADLEPVFAQIEELRGRVEALEAALAAKGAL